MLVVPSSCSCSTPPPRSFCRKRYCRSCSDTDTDTDSGSESADTRAGVSRWCWMISSSTAGVQEWYHFPDDTTIRYDNEQGAGSREQLAS